MQTVTICNDCPLFDWEINDCGYYNSDYTKHGERWRYKSADCGLVKIVFTNETYTPKREVVNGNTKRL